MTYELAKKLKDAGFPQNHSDETHYSQWPDVYIPTLSELIEACGEGFGGLLRQKDNHWLCFPFTNDAKAKVQGKFGATPEESVANLYLELQKK